MSYHIQYAKDEHGDIVHISNAVKKQVYYSIYEGSKMYPAKGEINVWHYRGYPGEAIDIDRAFHTDIQQQFIDSKKFDNYQASRVLIEHEAAKFIKSKFSSYSMIPDILFLDENNEIMFILEIFVTHKKSKEDIDKIQNYKIDTFELRYNKQTKFECQKIKVLYHKIIEILPDEVCYNLMKDFDYYSLNIIKKWQKRDSIQTFCNGWQCPLNIKCARFLLFDFREKTPSFSMSIPDAYENALYYFREKTPRHSVINTEKVMNEITTHPESPDFYCKYQVL